MAPTSRRSAKISEALQDYITTGIHADTSFVQREILRARHLALRAAMPAAALGRCWRRVLGWTERAFEHRPRSRSLRTKPVSGDRRGKGFRNARRERA
jgi:hypothetical protein